MKRWLRRVRGALGMGLTWAVGWTVVGMLGVLVAGALGFNTNVVDIWIVVFAYPAFLGGITFSTVLGIAGRRRRLDETSPSRFAAWGAAGGLLVSLIPVGLVAVGLATPAGNSPGPWILTAVIGVPVTLMSALSAGGSLVLARRAEERALLDAGAEMDGVGLTDVEVLELLEGRSA